MRATRCLAHIHSRRACAIGCIMLAGCSHSDPKTFRKLEEERQQVEQRLRALQREYEAVIRFSNGSGKGSLPAAASALVMMG